MRSLLTRFVARARVVAAGRAAGPPLAESDEYAARVDERLELAHAIHERVMQPLHAVCLALGSKSLTPAERNRAGVELTHALAALRTLIQAPPANGGRARPLHEDIGGLTQAYLRLPIQVELAPDLEPAPDSRGLARHFLREALRNVERHARPTLVVLRSGGEGGDFFLEVENDGVMRQRGGSGLGLSLLEIEAIEHGGRIAYGAEAFGRWRVRLSLPEAAGPTGRDRRPGRFRREEPGATPLQPRAARPADRPD